MRNKKLSDLISELVIINTKRQMTCSCDEHDTYLVEVLSIKQEIDVWERKNNGLNSGDNKEYCILGIPFKFDDAERMGCKLFCANHSKLDI